ncbi:MAG TPA: hypothetical protein VN026_02590 [Bacteroidia bacterium]|jgi:hypothetical protein|nr:hypothetical protein [Bacteroidia bacterium]
MADPEIKNSSVLGLKTELYGFITTTLIVVDICLVSTLTYTSLHPIVTFVLYTSFPVLAIIAMNTIERIGKRYPFIIFCSISPVMLGYLCYFSGLQSPGWLTAFPLITITLFLLDSMLLKLIYILLYLAALITSCLLIKMEVSQLFFIVMAIGIYGAVFARCLNYFQMQQMRIEAQKKLIEEKNKEVMDSIRYARRIQTSLLPTEVYIGKSIDRLN